MTSQSYLIPLYLTTNSKVIMEDKSKSEYANVKHKFHPVSNIHITSITNVMWQASPK